jgi:hypothetical protein
MATTPTTKLGIPLPVAGSGEPFTVAAYNFGINALDGAAGADVVTSASRPGSPFTGQIIHETDTDLTLVWDGVAWVPTGEVAPEDLDDLDDVTITTPVAGQKLVFDGTNWVNLEGYVYVETVYFTSNSTFTKATYPWLRAIRVKCQAGGGGGGGALQTGASTISVASGGAGGNYAESFITDIASLDASVTITRGDGGVGGNKANGGDGGTSSFGSLVIATGGSAGGVFNVGSSSHVFGAGPTSGSSGDLVIPGGGSHTRSVTTATTAQGGNGADSFLGRGSIGNWFPGGSMGNGYGYGGGGAGRGHSGTGTVGTGANGSNGIIIVELYA